MHYSIKRTEVEIREQIVTGKIWSEQNPTSFFGDDNVAGYERFLKIMNKVLDERMSVENIYELADIADGDVGMKIGDFAYWLEQENPEYPPYEE